MTRPRDAIVSEHARRDEDDDNLYHCNYCPHKGKGSTRMRNHLAGRGISACEKVPPQVRQKARKITESGETQKRRRLEEATSAEKAENEKTPTKVANLYILTPASSAAVCNDHLVALLSSWQSHQHHPHGFPQQTQELGNHLAPNPTPPFPVIGVSKLANPTQPVDLGLGVGVGVGGQNGFDDQNLLSIVQDLDGYDDQNLFPTPTDLDGFRLNHSHSDGMRAPAPLVHLKNAAVTENHGSLDHTMATDGSSVELNLPNPTPSTDDTNLGVGMGGGELSSTLPSNQDFHFSPNAMRRVFQRVSGASVDSVDFVGGAVLKYLMCTNSEGSVNPHFENLLEKFREYANVLPSWSLLNNLFTIDRSLTIIKEEVSRHMSNVQHCWATTGCTRMVFSLKEGEYVYGYYSSKGFIFAKAIDPTRNDPSVVDFKGVTHYLHHSKHHHLFLNRFCELIDQERSNAVKEIPSEMNHMPTFPCVRHQIKQQLIVIFKESEWAWSLIKKAVEVHKLIAEWYLSDWFRKALESRADFNEFSGGELENPLSRFISVILLEQDLKKRLSSSLGSGVPQPECLSSSLGSEVPQPQTEVKALLNESKFWDEGRELIRALTPVLKIPFLMDTLIPTAGYLDMAIDKAKRTIFSNDRRPMQQDNFWISLETFLENDTSIRQPLAAYLNPTYFCSKDRPKDRLKEEVKTTIHSLFEFAEYEQVDRELQNYNDDHNNPFAQVIHEHQNHPVELWKEYGQSLPLLQKLAIQILSQPVSCLCNQLKKHMFNLGGTKQDDYILKLNLKMMEEFKRWGKTCRPIDLTTLNSRRGFEP